MTSALREISLPGLQLFRRGKVRDTYDLGDRLLMVASDRISAFDVVLPEPIPNKGRVLTQLSEYWFSRLSNIVPHHLLATDLGVLTQISPTDATALTGRCMVVKKATRIDIECVVRGYLAGSAWVEYQRQGTACGEPLADGLVESSKLVEPLFTPAIKADTGHDENITLQRAADIVGTELLAELRDTSIQLYMAASAHAHDRGLIIADTKFEFGFVDGTLTLIDELLTPDSSRFWDAAAYAPGRLQASFDKQPVRDWLVASGWDKQPPPPHLPAVVVAETAARYLEAYRRITGMELDAA